MRVQLLVPDVPPDAIASSPPHPDAFSTMVSDVGALLEKAQTAEDSFASGTGDLQSAVYERARADVALSIATAAAQRTVQALQAVLNMQV
jgi:flagellar hook-basal body complex protein FliE